ncbi:MAG: DoxX family protein [Candidatus Woesearchaeota archaeon]
MDKYKWLTMPLLRYGIAFVYFYFAISQLLDPEAFTFFIPSFLADLLDPMLLVYFNAGFEILFGVLLVLGKYTRLSALLLAIHLFFISLSLGFTQNGVRDFGLTIATLAIFVHGSDRLCLDSKKNKN